MEIPEIPGSWTWTQSVWYDSQSLEVEHGAGIHIHFRAGFPVLNVAQLLHCPFILMPLLAYSLSCSVFLLCYIGLSISHPMPHSPPFFCSPPIANSSITPIKFMREYIWLVQLLLLSQATSYVACQPRIGCLWVTWPPLSNQLWQSWDVEGCGGREDGKSPGTKSAGIAISRAVGGALVLRPPAGQATPDWLP